MTTLQTRIHEIWNKEDFMIEVWRGNRLLAIHRHGVIGPWPHRNKTSANTTVSEFQEKFAKAYPGLSCRVLNATGKAAHGNTRLSVVRSTY